MRFDPTGPYEVEHEDLVYAEPAGEPLLARVYRPKDGKSERLPALIDVHGGAWTFFNREADIYFDRALAACGVVVVALDFRQGRQHPYPAAVADVVAGTRFAKAHADELGIDPQRVGSIGGSTGGHLILLAALKPNAAEYGTTPVKGVKSPTEIDASVCFSLPLWPIADPPRRYQYLLERRNDPPEKIHDRMFSPKHLIRAHETFFPDLAAQEKGSVLRILKEGEAETLPPIWVAHPELDENVPLAMSQDLVESYRKAGGEAQLEVFPGMRHSFANFPGKDADVCIEGMRRFVAEQLKRLKSPAE